MTWTVRHRDTCILCGGKRWQSILDLGDVHISGFPAPGEPEPLASPLHLQRCQDCDLVQIRDVVNPDLLYRTYWYRSGTNQTMRDALAEIARTAETAGHLAPGDLVVDIGSNDGTLLRSYSVPGLRRVGFEPSNIAIEARSQDPGATIINDYFRARPELVGQARIVTSIAMFYDLEEPRSFIRDIRSVLAPDGIWILQLAYLPYMFDRNAFDGICHEHLAYYSLATLDRLLQSEGFGVEDAQLVDLNEGSVRLLVRHGTPRPTARLERLRREEKARRLDQDATYEAFAGRVHDLRQRTIAYLHAAREQGAVVHGYGASTKGNTLLQFYGLGPDVVSAIWERQSQKVGRTTVATRIPIISEAEGRRLNPDLLFVLPWHFASEFVQREVDFIAAGGKMVVPLPELKEAGRATDA